MANNMNRRRFIQSTAAVGAGYWAAGGVSVAHSKSPNERIQMASIGIGGKGSSDSADAGNNGEMIAICDVDTGRLDAAANSRFKGAKKFTDYRKMLEEMKGIDAVTVSTPDHNHAPASAMAMKLGKHCFCQKPLTHSIYEARRLGEIAKEMKLATMMGNQGTAMSGLREAAALLQAGVLGKVSEVHVWTNRPIWPQGGPRPKPAPIPATLKWNEWLGGAPERPFANGYHPFSWRGWWDFGTGALGDMACHTLNMAFMGLNLRDPTSVVAETSGHNKDSYPKWSIIDFQFPALGNRDALSMRWYDGGKRPPKELLEGRKASGSGSLIIGEKGKLYSPDDYGARLFLLGDIEKPKVEFEKSPGHFNEWIRAIKGGPAATSNFPDYAGPLSETVLLGNLAVWADGKKIEWDSKKLVATNAPEVAHIVKSEYRKGWSLID